MARLCQNPGRREPDPEEAKFAADIMRFRRYLGEQYKKGFMLEGDSKVQKAIPIISIYFLGYQLEHVHVPVVKVLRNYYDAATGQVIPAREEFIESLTHDSFVIQIPYLGLERKTAAEKEKDKALEEKDRLIVELRKLR